MTKTAVVAFLSGLVFGAGLVVSGMTDPANIQGFLDLTGDFRPKLALVMASAVAVYATAIRIPFGGAGVRPFASIRPRAPIDVPLVGGAVLFGVGWGLSGYCPGPSLVALGSGQRGAFVFVLASALGLLFGELVMSRLETRRAQRAALGEPTRA